MKPDADLFKLIKKEKMELNLFQVQFDSTNSGRQIVVEYCYQCCDDKGLQEITDDIVYQHI